MRKLISEDSFQQDLDLLLKRSKNVPKKPSFLKRDLDARKNSEAYRALFCLPIQEKLDGKGRLAVSRIQWLCRLFREFRIRQGYVFYIENKM